jgi:cysteinyl-tRNA synthetase
MNHQVLGASIDIHGGGLDLVFPHHENEIAQSVCANHAPYATYWMHNGMLTMAKKTPEGLVQAAKMGKSLGNVVNIHEALQEFPAEALRLYYLQAHYRSPLPWTETALPEALAMLARLYEAREAAESMGGTEEAAHVALGLGKDATEVLELGRNFSTRFHEAMSDDLNTSRAMGLALALARAINRLANHKKARKRGGPVVAAAIRAFDELKIIGLMTMDSESFQEEVKLKRLGALGVKREDVERLIAERAEARARKDWPRADDIRAELDSLSIKVMDGADAVTWRVRLVE